MGDRKTKKKCCVYTVFARHCTGCVRELSALCSRVCERACALSALGHENKVARKRNSVCGGGSGCHVLQTANFFSDIRLCVCAPSAILGVHVWFARTALLDETASVMFDGLWWQCRQAVIKGLDDDGDFVFCGCSTSCSSSRFVRRRYGGE